MTKQSRHGFADRPLAGTVSVAMILVACSSCGDSGSGTDACTPACDGRPCGAPDGCGGTCDGPCSGGRACTFAEGRFRCIDCTPDCDGAMCGADDGCGMRCGGECASGGWCTGAACYDPADSCDFIGDLECRDQGSAWSCAPDGRVALIDCDELCRTVGTFARTCCGYDSTYGDDNCLCCVAVDCGGWCPP